jgi:hypothetical protein
MTPTAASRISSARAARHASSRSRSPAGEAPSRTHWLTRRWHAIVAQLRQSLRLAGAALSKRVNRQAGRSARAMREPRSAALRQDFHELRQLLDRHALARRTMPDLDRVERTLAHVGSRGLFKLPMGVLEKALTELDAVEQGVRLEELRARLGSALEAMRYRQARLERGHDLEVSEATHSLFSELERTWTAPMPLESLPLPQTSSDSAPTGPVRLV